MLAVFCSRALHLYDTHNTLWVLLSVQYPGDVKNRWALILKGLERMKSSLPRDGVLRLSFFLGAYFSI